MKTAYIKKTNGKLFVENEFEIIGGAKLANILKEMVKKNDLGQTVKPSKFVISSLGLALGENLKIEDKT